MSGLKFEINKRKLSDVVYFNVWIDSIKAEYEISDLNGNIPKEIQNMFIDAAFDVFVANKSNDVNTYHEFLLYVIDRILGNDKEWLQQLIHKLQEKTNI